MSFKRKVFMQKEINLIKYSLPCIEKHIYCVYINMFKLLQKKSTLHLRQCTLVIITKR